MVNEKGLNHNFRVILPCFHRAYLFSVIPYNLQYFKLQAELDRVRDMEIIPAAEYFMHREKSRMRSLQLRLEQLVNVHQNVCLKYSKLETENRELKAQISIRDERIRQLELSGRALSYNMQGQTERNISELASLQAQVQVSKDIEKQRGRG